MNHRTVPTITWLGEKIGQVIEVAYDADKAQSQDYIRVRIKFDVAKPLRRLKVFSLQLGEPFIILYDYKRIQRRCYQCQRLNHDRERCPLVLKRQQDLNKERRARGEVRNFCLLLRS